MQLIGKFELHTLFNLISNKDNHYIYDARGNLSKLTDAINGVDFQYSYDLSDRLLKKVSSDGSEIKYTYDNMDRSTAMSYTFAGQVKNSYISYNTDNRKGVTDLLSGGRITRLFDALNREYVTHINPVASTDPTLRIQRSFVNVTGSKTTTLVGTYGSYKRVSGVDTVLSNYSYTYDANGNIRTITDSDGKVTTYTYDQQNQLVRTDDQKSGTSTTYTYDVGGNIINTKTYAYTTEALGAQTASTNYAYGNANWKDFLTAYNGQTITYDAIGNPITYRDGLSFAWNGRQMSSATNGGTTSNYTYNNDGIRTSKTVGGVTTKYFVDGSTILAQQTGNDILWFMYDSDGTRVGFTYNGTAYYYTTNAQGDVTGIVDKDCNTVVQYNYDAWGKLLSTTGSLASTIGSINPFRYRGYYYDNETGFYSLLSRYYDPQTGRFINEDGYVSTGQGILGDNMFAYCLNNPVNNHDPSGKFALTATICGIALWKIGVALIGAIAVGIAAYVATDTLVKNPPAIPLFSLPKINVKPKTDSKEKDIAPAIPKDQPKSTTIYRYYSSKTENLAPRAGIDYDGLSFSIKPPRPGVSAVVTTIEKVNATGVLCAMPTGGTHVTVIPTNGTVMQWMEKGQSSMWSQTLSGVVVEWDGGN